MTDHGAFVLINVYVPNAGPGPERARSAYKFKFLEALKLKALRLREAGQEVRFGCEPLLDAQHLHGLHVQKTLDITALVTKNIVLTPNCHYFEVKTFSC